MVSETRGFSRGRSVYGRCCDPQVASSPWCSDCDAGGVEARFVPCCCAQAPLPANCNPCSFTPDRRD